MPARRAAGAGPGAAMSMDPMVTIGTVELLSCDIERRRGGVATITGCAGESTTTGLHALGHRPIDQQGIFSDGGKVFIKRVVSERHDSGFAKYRIEVARAVVAIPDDGAEDRSHMLFDPASSPEGMAEPSGIFCIDCAYFIVSKPP